MNELRSYTLTSAILKINVVCDDTMMLTPNVLTTELCDLLYNYCTENMCCYSFYIYSMGRIRIHVCKVRFVSMVKIVENLIWYARSSFSIFLLAQHDCYLI